jgi:hypothetical protein
VLGEASCQCRPDCSHLDQDHHSRLFHWGKSLSHPLAEELGHLHAGIVTAVNGDLWESGSPSRHAQAGSERRSH